MSKVSTTIRTDSDIKSQAQQIFTSMGMDMSTAINIFFHQVIRKNGLPFEVVATTPNLETREAIAEVQRMKADPSLGKGYTDVDDMMKELLG